MKLNSGSSDKDFPIASLNFSAFVEQNRAVAKNTFRASQTFANFDQRYSKLEDEHEYIYNMKYSKYTKVDYYYDK